MIKKHGNRFVPEKKTGNHKWIPLLLLFLLMLLSSCAAGYILGRSAFPESSGRRIDTILLTPDGDAAEQQMQQIFHLAGKINYTNGRPYAQGGFSFTVNQGKPLRTQTGALRFFMWKAGSTRFVFWTVRVMFWENGKSTFFRLRRNQESMSACSKTGSIPLRWQSMSG